MKIALTIALLLVFVLFMFIHEDNKTLRSITEQLRVTNERVAQLEKIPAFNQANYRRAFKHWQKVQADTKVSAELYVKTKVSEKMSQLVSYRSELVRDGFREAFRILTSSERDIFAQSVDLSIYTLDGHFRKLKVTRTAYIPIYLDDKRSPGEQLWQAITLPEEQDYKSQWVIFKDGSADKIVNAYHAEIKREGIEIPKTIE